MLLANSLTPSQSGILVGTCKGDVWFNKNQSLAITYSYPVGGCGVFGKIEDAEASKNFFLEVFENLKQKGLEYFEFASEEATLSDAILKLFSEKEIHSEMEYSYRFSRQLDDVPSVSSPYQIQKVSKPFLDELLTGTYHNTSMVMERLEQCWQTPEDFLEKSLAFVALKENEIAGIVFGSGRYENLLAIDIEVLTSSRKQGLAKALGLYFIQDCITHSLCPHWDCVASNIASIRLAESLGFEKIKERPFYWFKL